MIRPALYILAGALLLPAAIGLVDAWCYIMLGETVSPVDWDFSRAATAWIFTFLGIPVTGIASYAGDR